MRKLWPPTHDAFSIRIWSVLCSVAANLAGLLCLVRLGTNVLWCVGFPGAFAFFLIAGPIEEANSLWRISVGIGAWFAINLTFYFFIARFVITAFQPFKEWWPEKP